MAKETRCIKASSDVAVAVDKGASIDNAIKTLTEKDKSIKSRINDFVKLCIKEGETSIKVDGAKSSATVNAAETYTLNAGADTFKAVQEAMKKGLLTNVIKQTESLAIAPTDLHKAVELLNKYGIPATIVESLSIDASAYRDFQNPEIASPQLKEVADALKKCVSRGVVYRVKYGKAEKV